jgi:NTP pyrophosphatase (non-canonical NTP hydrolase)
MNKPEGWNDLRPAVQKFALAMETELRDNDHKGGWSGESTKELLARLHEETHEVWHATTYGASEEIVLSECADVANFAMMIADNWATYCFVRQQEGESMRGKEG